MAGTSTDISEEELDWLADKLYEYAKDDQNFTLSHLSKNGIYFTVTFMFHSIMYGMHVKYEQDEEQRTA